MYLLSVGNQLLSVDGLENLVGLLVGSVLGPIAIFATALTYFPNISRYAHDRAGLRGYVTGLYLIGIGSLVLVFSLHRGGGQWPIVRLFGLAAIGFGIFGELVDILHEDE